jgi:flagellar hook-associated protein 3 FlgL
MRITETRMLQMMSGRTMDTQSSIAKASTQVSTGVAVDKPSDDPVRWADGMRTKLSMDRRDAHESTVERARDNLQRTDDALGQIVDALSRVRDLAVLGGSESYNAAGRAGVAIEVGELFNSMLSSANVRSIDGEYLLAGSNSDVAPFDASGAFQGNDTVRRVETGDDMYKAASISGTWLTAASGTDVFGTVAALQTALEADDPDQVRNLIEDITASIEQVAHARTDSGVAASSLDRSLDVLSDLELSLTESFEDAVGADPIEAATWLANLGNQLEASRLVSERIVSMMSLGG